MFALDRQLFGGFTCERETKTERCRGRDPRRVHQDKHRDIDEYATGGISDDAGIETVEAIAQEQQ